jgi:hypothetical protein
LLKRWKRGVSKRGKMTDGYLPCGCRHLQSRGWSGSVEIDYEAHTLGFKTRDLRNTETAGGGVTSMKACSGGPHGAFKADLGFASVGNIWGSLCPFLVVALR